MELCCTYLLWVMCSIFDCSTFISAINQLQLSCGWIVVVVVVGWIVVVVVVVKIVVHTA